MWTWFVIIVSGLCTFLSFYMSFLAYRLGDSSAFLFAGFGLFSGGFFIASVIRIVAKRTNDKLSREPKPVSFVPHWFMMAAIIIAGIVILAAILIPIFFR